MAQHPRLVLSGLTAERWAGILARLQRECVDIEVPPETTVAGRVATMMEYYVDRELRDEPSQVDSPRLDVDGRPLVAWRHFARWLARHSPTNERIAERDMWTALRAMGWTSGVAVREGARVTRFWRAPAGFVALERRVALQNSGEG